jgi:hypothetical protein
MRNVKCQGSNTEEKKNKTVLYLTTTYEAKEALTAEKNMVHRGL